MKKSILAAAVLMLFAFSAPKAYSCSCAEVTQLSEFKRSESVFIGKFIKPTKNGAKFKITKSWKGAKAGKTIELEYIDLDGCNYDFKFVSGKNYLIYGVRSKADQRLYISLDCGRSNPVERAQEDIKNMDEIAKSEKK